MPDPLESPYPWGSVVSELWLPLVPSEDWSALCALPDDWLVAACDVRVWALAVEVPKSQIFGRFHRARNVAAYPGNGLGLAIVKAAVERAGGTVTFASSEAGTTFRVALPLA